MNNDYIVVEIDESTFLVSKKVDGSSGRYILVCTCKSEAKAYGIKRMLDTKEREVNER